MLYAARGIGKTYLSLTIALTIASGSQMLEGKWDAPKKRKVLLIDGEMPQATLQWRFMQLLKNKNFPLELSDIENLRIITPDCQEIGVSIPDLSTHEGEELEKYILDSEVILLDNISTLCRTGGENDAESWRIIQEWILKLRQRGSSVIFIHHAGKNGSSRGSSKMEDILDTVISLKDLLPIHQARSQV